MKSVSAPAALALVLAACGGGTPAEIVCDALCDQRDGCNSTPYDTCGDDCVQDNPRFGKFSESFASAFSDCVVDLSCDFADEQLRACVSPRLEPSERTRSFCSAHMLAYFECGYSVSTSDCESVYATWNDTVLEAVARCDTLSCDELDPCVEKAFDTL